MSRQSPGCHSCRSRCPGLLAVEPAVPDAQAAQGSRPCGRTCHAGLSRSRIRRSSVYPCCSSKTFAERLRNTATGHGETKAHFEHADDDIGVEVDHSSKKTRGSRGRRSTRAMFCKFSATGSRAAAYRANWQPPESQQRRQRIRPGLGDTPGKHPHAPACGISYRQVYYE